MTNPPATITAPDLDRAVAAMPLEEQVGQLIAGRVPGTTLDDETAAILRECHLGAVVLFARNIGTPDETRALTAAIQATCGRAGLPAIVAADQEGGRVQRLLAVGTSFPSAMALGATGAAEHARRWGLATARELRALGINTDFAPVLDCNMDPANPVIGTRSFGERPDEVARLGLAALAGLREGGVVGVGKHFPGHGDTALDSHYDLPTIPHDLARLRAVELAPFRAAIAAGVPAIMGAHVAFPALDPDGLPVTLSRRAVTGLLREEMGFAGVIVSDAMNMRAIAARWGLPEGCVRFIAAGGDLVEPIGEEREVCAAILAAARAGRLPAGQLAASVRRVLALRAWIAGRGPGDPAWLGAAEHRAWAAAIAGDALTVIRDDASLLPLRRDARIAVLDLAYQWTFLAATALPATSALADALRPRFAHVRGLVLDGAEPTDEGIAAARALTDGADVLVLGTRGASRLPAQAAFVNAALGWGVPTVAVALADPYDLAAYPAAPTALATYGADAAMLDALAAALVGEGPARGRLPVTLPMGER